MTSPATNRGAMLTVFLVIFIDLLGFGIVLPLLPRYADHFLTGWEGVSKGVMIGLIMSLFSAMQFFFAPMWGRWSDRIGRRPILLIGLFGSVVFYSLFGFASNLDPQIHGQLPLALIIISRIGAGICGANIAVAQAVIADSTAPEKRSSGMALIGAAFGIGFTFGPLIGAATTWLDPDSLGLSGYVAAGICLIALVIAWKKLPETAQIGKAVEHRGLLNIQKLSETLKAPIIGVLVFSFFLATYGFANFETSLALFTEKVFHYDSTYNFLIFAFTGFTLSFAQGYLYRKLAKTRSEVPLLRMGVFCMFLGLLLLVLLVFFGPIPIADATPNTICVLWFLAGLGVTVTGFSFLNPSINSLISRAAAANRQGETLGVNQSFAALARILGPVTATTLFFTPPTFVLPYVVAAIMMLFVTFLTWKVALPTVAVHE